MDFPTELPKKARKIYKDLKAIEEKRKTGFDIVITGPNGSGKSALINAFGRQRFNIFIEDNGLSSQNADLVITVIPADKDLEEEEVKYLKRAKISGGLVVLSKTDNAENIDKMLSKIEAIGIDFNKVTAVSALNRAGIDELKKRISDQMGIERVALAYQVPSFKSLAVEATAKATAKQNALISTIAFLPGADMPVLTANQIKMILEIGAAHGVTLDWQRAKEVLAVVGAGYGFREVARQLLDFVPGPGWIVKGAVAYSGTIAVAKAADLYFSKVVDTDAKSLASSTNITA